MSQNNSAFKSVLRGIAFLFFLAILAVALLAVMFSCAFFAALRHRTSIDPSQFSTSRQTMADDISDEQITPPQVGEFVLHEIHDNVQFPSNSDRHVFATYQMSDEQMVQITALLFTDSNDLGSPLSAGTECGDCVGSAQIFTDADIPYGYAFCGCFSFAQHTFNWMNGRWVLSASAASGSTLIEFVNSYPY